MLSHYKEQGVSVERGFRFLKDPLFFAHSLFLKSPARIMVADCATIMALIMIMGVALLVYALAERQLRLRLKEEQATIPSQTRKPTQTPTLRWVFQLFEGIELLLIYQNEQVIKRQVLNLRPDHLLIMVAQSATIIRLLGPQVQNCYAVPT